MNGKDLKPEKALLSEIDIAIFTERIKNILPGYSIDAWSFLGGSIAQYISSRRNYIAGNNKSHLRLVCVNGKRIA